MGDSGKRKLSAREILSDIRSGVDADGLKNKYGLSDKSLESVIGKLSVAGALTKEDVVRLKPAPGSAEPLPRPATEPRWRCPACNAPQPHEVAECPVCGVIAAKFAARQDRGHQGPALGPASTLHDVNVSQTSGSWTYVIWSIVALVAVGGGIIAWSMHRSNRNAEIASLGKAASQPSREVSSQPEELASQEESESIAYPASVMESFQKLAAEGSARADAPPTASAEPKPSVESKPPAASTKYVTGVLRQFNSGNFKAEVVEASKMYPVLFQFYRDT